MTAPKPPPMSTPTNSAGGGHTAGPWAVHPRSPAYVIPASHADRPLGGHTDDAEDLRIYAQEINIGGAWDRHRGVDEVLANALLIAAAPELLSALQNLSGVIEAAFPSLASQQQLVEARAAISKALGEQVAG